MGCVCASAVGAPAETAGASEARECPPPPDAQGEAWPGERRWQQLEAAGYRLGELEIRVQDVYVGSSLAWYQRLANRLHQETESSVVRELLTVRPGDAVRPARIYEAERVLRSQPFLTGARIIPVRCEDDRVLAEVLVRDAWTLQIGASFGQAGGESSTSFGFTDENFLGSGRTVHLNWSEGRERTRVEVGYEDRALLGTPWALSLSHADLSDGRSNAVGLSYPFRTAAQPWGVRTELEDSRSEIDFEQSGGTAYTAPVENQEATLEALRLVERNARGGWRAGAGWQRDYAEYGELEDEEPDLRSPPTLRDRRLQGPYVVAERFSSDYRSFRNLRAIGKTEDHELGLDARILAGRYVEGEGHGEDAVEPWFYSATIKHGAQIGEEDLLVTELGISGRYDDETGEVAAYRSAVTDFYHRTTERNTVVLHGEYDWRDDADPEDELYLGGFDGLLAYPDHFRSGDRRWRLHTEDRYVSDIILFDTIQMGYTAYLEAGSVRGFDGHWGRTLANAGAGLRLGSLRSSFGSVSYLTVAVPLVDAGDQDDYSIVVGSTVNF